MFGDDRRRPINLGGANSTATQASVLARVQQERQRRQNEKRRSEASSLIQATWKAHRAGVRTRNELLEAFDKEPIGTIPSTRFLVLGGGEPQRLVAWTNAALTAKKSQFFAPFNGPESNTWLVLLRQIAAIMLTQIVSSPQSEDAPNFLKSINLLVSPYTKAPHVSPAVLRYLLDKDLYAKLSSAIRGIPIEAKSTASLPGIISLSIAAFKVFPATSPLYSRALTETVIHMLTIPQFPNRIPISSLTDYSIRVPFGSFNLISSSTITQQVPDSTSTLHLLANLLTFLPPRYSSAAASSLKGEGLRVYLELLNGLLSTLPVGSLEPPKARQLDTMDWKAYDSDDDEPAPRMRMEVDSTPSISPPDTKTAKRLETLILKDHITSLLTAADKSVGCWPQFVQLLINIGVKWPSKQEEVLSTIATSNGGVIIKRLWRESVRSSPLGRDETGSYLKTAAHKDHWPPLLLLTDLYTQALLTMDDDEFFSRTARTSNTIAARNPLTIDEVSLFSRQLLNIVFPLYWNEDTGVAETGQIFGLSIPWALLRERITKCLQAIHARDSRRPFTPPRHWLMTDKIDVESFVDAAIAEERSLDEENETRQFTRRELAYLSPRLGILNNIPFAIPFETRVSIFRSFIRNDQMKSEETALRSNYRGQKIAIRRDHVSQDGFDHLNELGPAWKSRLAITFIDQFGQEEAGIDGGGVFKEFLTSLGREVFDTNRGLWLATSQQELYPNSHSYAKEPHQLNWYRFIGRVLGKALYEDILVDVSFAGFFLAKWLGKQSFLDDLASLDPDLYRGLIYLKNYTGNPEDLSLDFSITEDDLGITRTVDLIKNGSSTPVTRENRLLYIYLVSYYRLTQQIKKQSEAFFEGLSEIIDPKWLRMFNQQELKILVGGAEEPIDLDDLRNNVVYGGLYDEDHPTVRMFWKVVKGLDQERRKSLLRFVTSCARPPLLGFKELRPKFAIRDAGIDESRLPTASTCVNLLKLPLYQDEETLRRKLIHAISSGAGFDLS